MSLDDRFKDLQWTPFKCQNVPPGIQLYYNFSSSDAGLCLSVTDLCLLWDTSLTHEGVVDEAQEQGCSIDPSESYSQFQTLLTKLKQSLIGGHNELGRRSTAESKGLSIQTRLRLPVPLKLLKWTFEVQQQSSARFAAAVTVPLLYEAALLKQRMEILFQVIKDKDHVLTKVLDKIDNSAIDLGLIFPGISGAKSRKQRVGIAEASKHIPGMASFDRNSWEAGLGKGSNVQSNGSLAFDKILVGFDVNIAAGYLWTDWTHKLSKPHDGKTEHASTDSGTDPEALDIKSPLHSAPTKIRGGDSGSPTEYFEDLVDTPQRQGQSGEQASKPKSSQRARQAHAHQPASSSSASSGRPPPVRTSSVSDSSDSSSQLRTAKMKSKKATSKIGMLGGKRKVSPAPRTSASPPVGSSASKPSRKLGLLGNRQPKPHSSLSSPIPGRIPSETPKDPDTASNASSTPPPRVHSPKSTTRIDAPAPVNEEPTEIEESMKDKVMQRREELKRAQAQAKIGPTKKKARRF